MEIIIQKYMETVKDAKIQHARFDELRDEREYYKNWLPTSNEAINRLAHEVDELREASKSIIVNKNQMSDLKSKFGQHQNQSVMIDRTVQDELRDQEVLRRKNEELKQRLSGVDAQMASQFQNQHSERVLEAPRAHLVRSEMPGQFLPDNILDNSCNSGYGNNVQSNHYTTINNNRQANHPIINMEPPRLSNTSHNNGDHGRLSQQNFGRESGISNQGNYHNNNPMMMNSGHNYQPEGNNFKKQQNPQVSNMGGGSNP